MSFPFPLSHLLALLLLVAGCATHAGAVVSDAAFRDELRAAVVLASIDERGSSDVQLIAPPDAAGSVNDAFRIASVTKTFVAATVLRLMEQGRLPLDAPLHRHIHARFDALLRADGYDTNTITLRHVLSHTAGFNDHAQDPRFIAVWQANPATHWPRERHIERLVEWTQPVGVPGERYAYSDSGYVLLGHVIERATGKPLAVAVRELLNLDALNLDATWWEQAEAPAASRAHQLFDGEDTYHWDASFDLYGGGGLVATVPDIARFFHALFNGRVFEKPETLELMLSNAGLPQASPYRVGVFEYDFAGHRAYGHAGFWGTLVAHEPASGRTFAASAYDRRDYGKLKDMAATYFSGQ